MWEYTGSHTLSDFLENPNGLKDLSINMGVSNEALVPTIMKDVLQCLKVRHSLTINRLQLGQNSKVLNQLPYR